MRIRDEDGTLIIQNVHYEWLPKYCEICQKLGHICADKDKEKADEAGQRGKGIWRPKERMRKENSFSTPVNAEKQDSARSYVVVASVALGGLRRSNLCKFEYPSILKDACA